MNQCTLAKHALRAESDGALRQKLSNCELRIDVQKDSFSALIDFGNSLVSCLMKQDETTGASLEEALTRAAEDSKVVHGALSNAFSQSATLSTSDAAQYKQSHAHGIASEKSTVHNKQAHERVIPVLEDFYHEAHTATREIHDPDGVGRLFRSDNASLFTGASAGGNIFNGWYDEGGPCIVEDHMGKQAAPAGDQSGGSAVDAEPSEGLKLHHGNPQALNCHRD